MKKYLRDLFYISVFIVIVGLFFWPTLTKGKLPIPSDSLVGLYHPWRDFYAASFPRGIPFKNFLITDPVRQQIPYRRVGLDQWKKGQWPSWNPYVFSGMPLAANIQAAIFYPLNLLFFLLNFSTAWTLLVILQPLLGGIFLYLYLRHLKLGPPAAILGAIAWSFSGFNVAWLTWGTMGHVGLWLPLILFSVDKLLAAGRERLTKRLWGYLVLFVGALTLQFLAGHAQISFYVLVTSTAYVVWRVWERPGKVLPRQLIWLLGALAVFILMTAVQWIPLIKLIGESGRLLEAENWQKPGWFLPWQHLAQFMAPDYFGNPTTLNYWGEWNYGELVGYIGIIPLLLSLLVLLRLKKAATWFWLGVLGVTLILLLPTPFAKLPYLLKLPILAALQPTRLMMLVDFALSVLAAYGAESLLRKERWRSRGSLVAIGAVLTVLWIVAVLGRGENWAVARRNLILPTALFIAGGSALAMREILAKWRIPVLGMLLILTSFDLLRFGAKFTPFTSPEYFFPSTRVIEFLQKQGRPFRVAATDPRIFPPNTAAFYGIETVEGYDPLYPEAYAEFMTALARGKADLARPFGFNRIITLSNITSPLLPLLNVRYILTLNDLDLSQFRKVYQEGETRVYEFTGSLPRFYWVEEAVSVGSQSQALARLFQESFVSNRQAVVAEELALIKAPLDSNENIELVSYQDSFIQLKVQASNPRFLVILNPWEASWKATIDSVPAKIYRTNFLFQGLLVPPGRHNLTLKYY